MKRLATLTVVVVAFVWTATAQSASFSLSDHRVGTSKAELVAQRDYSARVVKVLTRPSVRWRIAPRHATCWAHVPWARVCNRARLKLHAHLWLLKVASRRYDRLYGAPSTDPSYVRAWVERNHPCLAEIIALEDRTYDPTISNGGGHGDTSVAYGIPQADPGTKMAWAGPDWRTNPWTQIRWMIAYTVKKFGSECAAAYARVHGGMY